MYVKVSAPRAHTHKHTRSREPIYGRVMLIYRFSPNKANTCAPRRAHTKINGRLVCDPINCYRARRSRGRREQTRGEFWPLWSQIRQIPSKLDDNAAETGNIMQLSSNYTTAAEKRKREQHIHPPIKLSLLLDNLLDVTPPREPTPELHMLCAWGACARLLLQFIHASLGLFSCAT